MDLMLILRNLAIILVAAKLCGLLARKLKAPQVVGEIIAGLIIGPSLLNLVVKDDFISGMAEIGVILLMFSAGLGTDLKELVKTGPVALLIALSGVAVPLVGGMLVYMGFGFGTPDTRLYEGIFMGTVLAATSVSITVQALKEMGHLKGKVGTTILSAAILDDIIGIILLTVVIGFKSPDVSPVDVCIKTILFFVLAIVLGFALYFLFKWISKHWPHSRRIPIFGLVLCFAAAYCSEEFFGIADITGAYVAGIILCNINDAGYIERKMDISSYMIFGPIFFASIGLQTSFDNFNMHPCRLNKIFYHKEIISCYPGTHSIIASFNILYIKKYYIFFSAHIKKCIYTIPAYFQFNIKNMLQSIFNTQFHIIHSTPLTILLKCNLFNPPFYGYFIHIQISYIKVTSLNVYNSTPCNDFDTITFILHY